MSERTDSYALANVPAAQLAKAREVLDDFRAVVNRTNVAQPSKEDRAELDRLLREFPALWDLAGDLMEQAAWKLIQNMESTYPVDATLRTAWREFPRQLARPGDGRLERLLVQQAVLCWLQLGYMEYHYSHYLTNGNTPIAQADFWERRLSAAQRRYLRAIETLARVRRLNLPALQVNIGAQQVNQLNQGVTD